MHNCDLDSIKLRKLANIVVDCDFFVDGEHVHEAKKDNLALSRIGSVGLVAESCSSKHLIVEHAHHKQRWYLIRLNNAIGH